MPVPGEWTVSAEAEETTLGDLGPFTPTGSKPFQFNPKDIALLASIGREVDANPFLKDKAGRQLIWRIALSLSHLDGEDLNAKSAAEAAVHVGRLNMGDLMYLGMVRRAQEDSGLVELDQRVQCEHCHAVVDRVCVDLSKVAVSKQDRSPTITYALKDPWSYRGVPVEVVRLQTPSVSAFLDAMTAEEFDNTALYTMRIIAASIVGMDGTKVVNGAVRADDLSKRDENTGVALSIRDFNNMNTALGSTMAGPEPVATWLHDGPGGCGSEQLIALEWYAGFF